jgi:hypothetical protein
VSVSSSQATFTTENPLEGMTKLGTEYGVNNRIKRGIEVPQPQEERNHILVEFVSTVRR